MSSPSTDHGTRSARPSRPPATLDAFLADEANVAAVGRFADMCREAPTAGNKLMSCGNGGSMCDAMHFAEEWTGRFRGNRGALPAIAFSDPSQLTCIANDFGFDEVFARSVEAYGKGDARLHVDQRDSRNAIRAIEQAKQMGVRTVALVGKGGGESATWPTSRSSSPTRPRRTASRSSIKILHIAIEAVERAVFPENY